MIISIFLGILFGWIFGLWLNKQAYDELKIGNKWFALIIWASAALFIIAIAFLRNYQGFESIVGSIFFLATIAYMGYKSPKIALKRSK